MSAKPMLSLCLLLAFAHPLVGAPTMDLEESSPQRDIPSGSLQPRASDMFDENRTIWDIVWSCLATIFACTWVSVHPNIPSPKASWLARFKSRLMVMAYAWIAPECVTMWAMRQWFSARRLVKIYNELKGIPEDTRNCFQLFWDTFFPSQESHTTTRLNRWTLTHGFFAQMGGYMIFREAQPYWTLFLEDIDLERDMNLVPYYTEDELMDRSKGDMLSKSVALLQTLWFVTQYASRVCWALPLTELETITLAFAVLNIVTYALWWNKPLNIQCPIRISETPLLLGQTVAHEPQTLHETHVSPTLKATISTSASLFTPVAAAVDIFKDESEGWELLNEIPWFSHTAPSDGAVVSTPHSGSQILTVTSDFTELEKNKDDQPEKQMEESEADAWKEPNELPWFPALPGVTLPPPVETENTTQRIRRVDSSGASSSPPTRWYYHLPWKWSFLPRYVVLVVDGGWYTIHIRYREMNDDDESSFSSRHDPLSVDFYIPLFLRNRPWKLQMCIVLPFWSPYIVFMIFYTFGPYHFFVFLLRPLASMTGTSVSPPESWEANDGYPLQVPTFYAGPKCALNRSSRRQIWYTIFFLTSIFGAIHGLGWSSHFPSAVERLLWRISSLTICGVPPTIALWALYRSQNSFPVNPNTFATGTISSFWAVGKFEIYRLWKFLAPRPAIIGMPLYILGRLALITIAFTSLRNLPPETFQSVPWTTIIPHL